MLPILFHTPWFNVYSYGLCMALGYALGTWCILREVRRQGLPTDPVFDMLLVMMVLGVLGARLTFLVEILPWRTQLPPFFALEAGGLTFYGAFLLSAVWCVAYLRWRGLPVWTVMDAVGLGWPLGGILARLGCFLNGCCYGPECSAPWAVVFPTAGLHPRHPTQLYEAGLYLALFLGLTLWQPRQTHRGQLFFAALVAYALARFGLEFWRAENPPLVCSLTFSQWLSLGLVAVGGGALHLVRRGDLLILPATGASPTLAATAGASPGANGAGDGT